MPLRHPLPGWRPWSGPATATGPRARATTHRSRVVAPATGVPPVVDDLLTVPGTITGVERPTWPLVLITEPGRTPLQLLVHRPLDIGRDGDGLLLADSELS